MVRSAALVLIIGGLGCLYVCLSSIAGHPPYSGLGFGIVPVSASAAIALFWCATAIVRNR